MSDLLDGYVADDHENATVHPVFEGVLLCAAISYEPRHMMSYKISF